MERVPLRSRNGSLVYWLQYGCKAWRWWGGESWLSNWERRAGNLRITVAVVAIVVPFMTVELSVCNPLLFILFVSASTAVVTVFLVFKGLSLSPLAIANMHTGYQHKDYQETQIFLKKSELALMQ